MSTLFNRYETKAREILESNRSGSYTKPSPSLYPHQWNWDSGFIAIGRSHYDTAGAMSEIESLFSAQWGNGMLPQIVFNPEALGRYFPEPDFWQAERSPFYPRDKLTSGITMPPIHAVAVEKIYINASNRRKVLPFLERIFPRLLALHEYLYRERDPGRKGLVYIRHPWESGIDNSPAWDPPLQAIKIRRDTLPAYHRKDLEHVSPAMRPTDHDYDRYVFLVDLFRRLEYDESPIGKQCPFLVIDPMFNAILCRANQSLARIARILGKSDDRIRSWEEQTSRAIKEHLWCPDNRMFYPYDLVAEKLIYAETSSGFTPLFAGAASREQADILYSRLNSVSFCALHQGNCYTIPNYDTQKQDFDRSNYWRGPVWTNVNFILAEGLARYGYTLKADNLRRDLLQLPIRFGFYEYFDSFTGKGYGSNNFSWTAALFIALLKEYYQKTGISKPVTDAIRRFTTRSRVLNSSGERLQHSTGDLAGELMKSIRHMRDEFYNTERGLVDYDAIRNSDSFHEYRALTNELRFFDLDALAGDDERLAFWINLYNTLVVDGIVSLSIERSALDFPGFFSKIRYDIGGLAFSLNDMEHGILRGNRHPPFNLIRPFRHWDRRRWWSIREVDPRIHFALVCGSRSCAPIDYYDPQRINNQLDEAARSFINSSEVLVFPEENRIMLSEIFRWYESDFGGRGGVVDFIAQHLTEGVSRDYLVSTRNRLFFEYLFYDWDLNRWGR